MKFLRVEGSVDLQTLDIANIQLGNLQWNISRSVGVHRAKFQEQEKEHLITGSNLKDFFSSVQCQKAREILAAKKDVNLLSSKEVVIVRNYLVCKFMIDNVLRPCALFRLPVKAFEGLKPDPETGLYAVALFYDKTVGATGRATYIHMTGSILIQSLATHPKMYTFWYALNDRERPNQYNINSLSPFFLNPFIIFPCGD